jgi:chromosomal replication initiation ATPase DnaA
MNQPRLFEFRMGERAPETLVVAEANRDAAQLLTGWRNWPSGVLALIGPPGSGKTHISLAWAMETGARQSPASAPPDAAAAVFAQAGGRVLVDDADKNLHEPGLWRLLDLARSQGGAVLLTGATAPAFWPVALPDLRSRLAAAPVARLGEPDETLMEVILYRICREQFILLSDDAAKYVARRLPRTFAAARTWAQALDAELERGARPVTLASAKKALLKAQTLWGGEEG